MNEEQKLCCVPGSLACGPKGANWVATLKVGEGTEIVDIEIGSINLGGIMENDSLKQEFVALMKKVINHIVVYNDPESKVVFGGKEPVA